MHGLPQGTSLVPTQRYFHLHLVSDATGETLINVGRAAASQYKQTHSIEHIHSLVRTQTQIERALREIEQAPGIVLRLSGRTHELHSAAAVARGGEIVWHDTRTARLTMRRIEPAFIGRYLARAGEDALSSVGAYQLEGLGIQLFDRIDGDYFTILGLPLLPLLAFLRKEGVLE